MEQASVIRTLIVDDNAKLLERLKHVVTSLPEADCVGVARNGVEAVRLASDLAPDLILMDLMMPRMDGIEATTKILAYGSGSRIIALTAIEDDDTFRRALAAGVSGFMLKSSTRAEIHNAIRVVANGESMLSPKLITRVVRRYPRPKRGEHLPALKSRDVALLRLIAEGLSNDEIAAELALSPTTVKSYVSRLLAATGCRDRAQLVILAYENGIVGSQPRQSPAGYLPGSGL